MLFKLIEGGNAFIYEGIEYIKLDQPEPGLRSRCEMCGAMEFNAQDYRGIRAHFCPDIDVQVKQYVVVNTASGPILEHQPRWWYVLGEPPHTYNSIAEALEYQEDAFEESRAVEYIWVCELTPVPIKRVREIMEEMTNE